MFSCIIAKHAVFEFGLQLGFSIQPRHQPIENIRSRQLVSYPFILLSMGSPCHYSKAYRLAYLIV
jgi:hypothetical protein